MDFRARANHALYLAKILLAAWRSDLEQQRIPSTTLAQAYAPGAREHLITAYGWFLLTVSQASVPPAGPTRCCDELPPLPAGKVLPGEINEFRQLEASGWLGDMLRTRDIDTPVVRRPDNLAVVAGDAPGPEQMEGWLGAMSSLFDRMGDSLDEC